jgi:hypothetical protein
LDMRANSLELDWLNKSVGKRLYVFIWLEMIGFHTSRIDFLLFCMWIGKY